MTKMEEVLKVIEETRYQFSNQFGQMIYDTGAIVVQDPNFRHCIKGLLFQIARDHGVKI